MKKKPVFISRDQNKKPVRIDHKTVILVNMNIPDDEARMNWLLKMADNKRKFDVSLRWDRSRNAIKPTELWE